MLTKLDYINSMLATIGLAKVSAVDEQHPQYDKANTKLLDVSSTVQQKGWWFNKSTILLRPDNNGEITVPSNTLSIRVHSGYGGITQRGTKLWNMNERTHDMKGPVGVDLIELLPFDLLPATAMSYIGRRAKHEFFVDRGGSNPKLSVYAEEMQMALVDFQQENLRVQRVTGLPPRQLSRRDRTT